MTKADAIVAETGSLEGSNHRCINKMLVSQVLPTCQLQMGMTELKLGSVWNTMPAHVHSRRMEAYFYFEVPEEHAVCHFMGEVDETRHVWMKGEQLSCLPNGLFTVPLLRIIIPLSGEWVVKILTMETKISV